MNTSQHFSLLVNQLESYAVNSEFSPALVTSWWRSSYVLVKTASDWWLKYIEV